MSDTTAYPDFPVGYCTNVHAGTSIAEAQANLTRFAGAIRNQVVPNARLPVGLWLSETVADELVVQQSVFKFRDWLAEQNLIPYTLNGFPQVNFHQAVVKHAVYEPTWSCHSRARYSMCLAQILDKLLPAGSNGSISTVPIGWAHCPWHAEEYRLAADNLLEVARFLDHLAQHSGREIVLAIEPEPGCILNTAEEVIEFFQHYLFSGPDARIAQRYLSVCHDVCHSGVMFEPQIEALEAYRQHGIRVGKVQLSSAVHVPWDKVVGQPEQQAAMLEQLRSFNEPKYLHQTTCVDANGKLKKLAEDLPLALQSWTKNGDYPQLPWRVHFHVPIFLPHFGALETTQADIATVCQYMREHGSTNCVESAWFTGHYEVETYAWTVLPSDLQAQDLASGIAQELEYARELLAVPAQAVN